MECWPLNSENNPEKKDHVKYVKMADGKRYLRTWFTWEVAKRYSKVTGPRGGQRLEEFPRTVYYRRGRFYKAVTNKNPECRGSYILMEPITGNIFTVFPNWQRRHSMPDTDIKCRDGYPIEVGISDGISFWGQIVDLKDGLMAEATDYEWFDVDPPDVGGHGGIRRP